MIAFSLYCSFSFFFFFFNDTATTEIYTLSLHDALPIFDLGIQLGADKHHNGGHPQPRSEEHTSELQSHSDLVCRLLLEKKKQKRTNNKSRKNRQTRSQHQQKQTHT